MENVRVVAGGFAEHGDAGQMAAQFVVNVACDAGAFVFNGLLAFQGLHLAAHPAAGIQPDYDANHAQHQRRQERAEPPRLPKIWQQHKGHCGSLVIPDSGVVAGQNVKSILARGT